MAKAPMPRKLSQTDILIYGIIIAALLGFCVVVGAAMDFSIGSDGKVDFARIGSGMERVTSNPDLIAQCFSNKQSYAIKMLVFGAMGIGLYLLYKYSEGTKRLHRKGMEHGSAKFGDKKEMRSMADNAKPVFKPLLTIDGKRIFDKKGDFAGVYIDNNIILSKNVKMSLDTHSHGLNLNILVEGGSGTGKTRSIVEPNIMQLNTSYVISDPKGEILQHTGKLLTEAGYELRVLNLIEMEHSNNYNPFHYVYDKDGKLSQDAIQKLITTLFTATKTDGEKEDFWSQKGKTVLNAIIMLLFEESAYNAKFDENGEIIEATRDQTNLNFYAVAEKMRRLSYPPRGSQQPDGFFLERQADEDENAFRDRQSKAFLCKLDKDFIELEKRKPDGCLALDLYKEIRNAPEETGQSFLSSANVKTFMFNLENVKNLTCCDNIELEKLGERKSALFLIISSQDKTYNFLANMMYTQMFDALSIQASFKHGGTLPIHVRCILDEFANIGEIPNFDQVIAIVRSWGVSVTIILQSLSQLKSRYEKTYETIIDCCATTIFLGGKGKTTLKELSETLGKETIDVKGQNKTKGKQSSTSENNSIMGRELMTEGELASMPRESCLVMCQYHNPFIDDKYPLDKHPNYKYLSHYDKNNAYSIDSLHSVKWDELKKKERATSSTESVELTDSLSDDVVAIYKADSESDAEITFETYEDAELYGGVLTNDFKFSEEYNSESDSDFEDTPMYGDISEMEITHNSSFDFPESVGEKKAEKEVMNHETETDSIPVSMEDSEDSTPDGEKLNDNDDELHYAMPESAVDDSLSVDEIDESIALVDVENNSISNDFLASSDNSEDPYENGMGYNYDDPIYV